MKVRELIEQLNKFDPDLEVWVRTCCELQKTDAPNESISEASEDNEKYLIIESDGILR